MSYSATPDADRLTVNEYLEREAVSEAKHEYVTGLLYAFAGASRRHNLVVSRLLRQLLPTADGTGCEVFTSDMLLRAAYDIFYYPDITIVCDPNDNHERFVTRPCLVIEVLPPTTADKDLREKLLLYRNIESLQGYLIVAPDDSWLELHERQHDGAWRHRRIDDDTLVELPCLEVSVNAAGLIADLPPSSA